MNNTFRDFYYLDREMVKNYISTIEDGIELEKQISVDSENPNWNFELSTGELQKILEGIGITIPEVTVRRSGKKHSVVIDKSTKPTETSLYNRLENYLEPVIQYLEGFDKKIWDQIEEGFFVKFSSKIKLPTGLLYGKMLNQFASFFELVKDFNMDLSGVDNSDFQAAYRYGQKVAEKRNQNIKLLPLGSPNNKKMYFVGNIKTEYLYGDLEELDDNNFFVFGRVEKVIQKGEKYTIFDPTLSGLLKYLNREEIRKIQKQNKNVDNAFVEDLFAVHPAIVIKVIAIYK